MITMHPRIYIAVIVPLLAIGLIATVLLIGEIIREWKEYRSDKHDKHD